jgi:tetratricopeptide (TPR) repeat protein
VPHDVAPQDHRPVASNLEAQLAHATTLIQQHRLEEAEAAMEAAPEEYRGNFNFAVMRAVCAQQRGDLDTALARWSDIRTLFPDAPYAYAAAASIHLAKADFDSAEAAIAPAVARFPIDADVLAQAIQIAITRADWSTASARLNTLNTALPHHPFTTTVARDMQAVIAKGQADASHATLRATALAAEERGDWLEAQTHWRTIYHADRTSREALLKYQAASARAQDMQTADELFAVAIERFPDDLEAWMQYALAPGYLQDWPASAARWREVSRGFPDVHIFSMLAAEALHQAGDTAEAEAILDRAVQSDPTSLQYGISQALFAQKIDKWREAGGYWDALAKLHPENAAIRELRGEAIWRAGLQNTEDQLLAARPPAAAAIPGADGKTDLARLMLDFEGLGDNCEFGIVQRYFGAEPLGLFRFTAIKPHTLINQLAEQFASIGDPAHTVLTLTDQGCRLDDDRGLFYMHTYIDNKDLDHAKVLTQQIKRMNFLKRELIEDLRAAEKIFVFKDSEQVADDDLLKTLAKGLAAYGPNFLLVVRLADAQNPPGSTRLVTSDIMVGHLETIFPMSGPNFDYGSWRNILETAHQYNAKRRL